MTRGPVVVNDEAKRRMKSLLAEIQSGAFARDWMKESRNGRPRFNPTGLRGSRASKVKQVGARLGKMMPWLSDGRLVDKAKN